MTQHATDRRTGTVEATGIWLLGAVKQVLAQAEGEAEGVCCPQQPAVAPNSLLHQVLAGLGAG